jgi:hypothetical protein
MAIDPIGKRRHEQQNQHRDGAESVDQHIEPGGSRPTAVRSDPIRNQDDEAKDRRNDRHSRPPSCLGEQSQVAMVKPTIVAIDKTFVMDQRIPFVEMPLLANIGVSQRYVVPNKNKATPPILRIVNMIASTTSLLTDRELAVDLARVFRD